MAQGDVSKADTLLADDFVHNDVVWGRQQLVAGPKVRAHRPTCQLLSFGTVSTRAQASLPIRLVVIVSSEGALAPCCYFGGLRGGPPSAVSAFKEAWRLVCLQAFKQFVSNVREAYPDLSVWIKEVGVCDTTRLFVHWQGPLP